MSGERLVVGLHPVHELLRSDAEVSQVLVAASRKRSPVLDDILRVAGQKDVEVLEVDRDTIDRRAEGLVHQGVLAVSRPFTYVSAIDLIPDDGPALIVALDGITDPHNLGSIGRSAEALGAHGLIITGKRSAGVSASAEKAAAGALAHLPVARVTNLNRALELLRDHGVWVLGLDGEADQDLSTCNLLSEPVALVIGAEGKGLAPLTKRTCDVLVRLPLQGRISSLNASVAAGIGIYEILRGRSVR